MGLATEQTQNNSSIGERKLWCFVLLTAVAAAKRKVPGALEYFESEQFVTVAAFLDLDVEWLRQQALSDKPLGEEVNQIYLMDYESLRLTKRRLITVLKWADCKAMSISWPNCSKRHKSGSMP
jgi:hypothetical protein